MTSAVAGQFAAGETLRDGSERRVRCCRSDAALADPACSLTTAVSRGPLAVQRSGCVVQAGSEDHRRRGKSSMSLVGPAVGRPTHEGSVVNSAPAEGDPGDSGPRR